MMSRELLAIVQEELQKHDFDCFVDRSQPVPPSHRGVVVSGCPHCKKTFYTAQFIERLSFDILPLISERESGFD